MSSVTNLAKNLTDTIRSHAGRVAVRVDNAAMTYRALDEASARVAGLLHERGLGPGDRVGIMMPNVDGVSFPICWPPRPRMSRWRTGTTRTPR